MTDDKIVEAMARAICKARGVDPDYCAYGVASTKGDYTCRVTFWQTHIADARAALSVARPMIEAETEKLKRMLKWREHQIETSRKYWLRDAKEALAGDMRVLRNRVELCEAGPVDIVLSAPPATGEKENG